MWTDIAPALEADFNDWYNREHLPDRILRMPGFLRGRRYETRAQTPGDPKFLTLYDLQDTTVMLSAAHTALRKQRTARDLAFVPQFRNTIKAICDVVCRVGEGDGGLIVLQPVRIDPAREGTLAQALCQRLLPALAASRGVAGACYARRNASVTQASAARDDRAGDRYAEGLIVIEASSDAGVDAAVSALNADALTAMGAAPDLIAAPAVLRMTYALRKPPAC